jgi:hypothetical protein
MKDINVFIKHLSCYLSLSVCCGLVAGNVVSPMAGVVRLTAGELMLPVQPVDQRCTVGCAAEIWAEGNTWVQVTFLAEPGLDTASC